MLTMHLKDNKKNIVCIHINMSSVIHLTVVNNFYHIDMRDVKKVFIETHVYPGITQTAETDIEGITYLSIPFNQIELIATWSKEAYEKEFPDDEKN